jgi:hypothetical protein
MSRCHRACLLALTLAAAGACAGDDDAPMTSARDAGRSASCPNLAGTWTIASHCGTSLVGMSVAVAQDTCAISTGGAFAGLSGDVASDGSFMLAGTVSGMSVSCTGTATATRIDETCTGNCSVTLTR